MSAGHDIWAEREAFYELGKRDGVREYQQALMAGWTPEHEQTVERRLEDLRALRRFRKGSKGC